MGGAGIGMIGEDSLGFFGAAHRLNQYRTTYEQAELWAEWRRAGKLARGGGLLRGGVWGAAIGAAVLGGGCYIATYTTW
jgi:hypothetical protein